MPDRVRGVITDLEPGDTSAEPTSFELETAEGTDYTIRIAEDVEYGFDLAHLHEHLSAKDPVIVAIEERNGELFALEIDDA